MRTVLLVWFRSHQRVLNRGVIYVAYTLKGSLWLPWWKCSKQERTPVGCLIQRTVQAFSQEAVVVRSGFGQEKWCSCCRHNLLNICPCSNLPCVLQGWTSYFLFFFKYIVKFIINIHFSYILIILISNWLKGSYRILISWSELLFPSWIWFSFLQPALHNAITLVLSLLALEVAQ